MSIKSKLKGIARYILRVPVYNTTVVVKELAPTNQFSGRNILITGGGRGLGYYMAKKLVNNGARVVICGRSEETLKKAAQELGEGCEYLCFDVTEVGKIKELFKKAQDKLGCEKIDSLISNAGISLHEGGFRNVSESDWDAQMDTNLKGNYFMVSEFIKYLETFEDKSGNIVVISSERGMRADDIPYGLTKAATNSFIKSIAKKVACEGIRLNGVGPGVTTSDMTGFSRDGNMYVEWQNGNRLFLPEEVANVVEFLLSEASMSVSGEIINCDLGNYIANW
ncbi:MAG: SDR family NAD(P)-dependent oxidoreductase [Monoglobales bacterium]